MILALTPNNTLERTDSMKTVASVSLALVGLFAARGAFAEERASGDCVRSARPVVCVAMRERAEKAKELANGDEGQWAKVAYLLIENARPPFAFLPNGDALNIYSGEQRRTAASHAESRDERRQTERLKMQYRLYVQTILNHHKRGVLTYDMYPCVDVCDGHRRGFEWAEANSVREFRDCEGDSQSFIEGCTVSVTRRKGLVLPNGS
jgi:hypothetical protein